MKNILLLFSIILVSCSSGSNSSSTATPNLSDNSNVTVMSIANGVAYVGTDKGSVYKTATNNGRLNHSSIWSKLDLESYSFSSIKYLKVSYDNTLTACDDKNCQALELKN